MFSVGKQGPTLSLAQMTAIETPTEPNATFPNFKTALNINAMSKGTSTESQPILFAGHVLPLLPGEQPSGAHRHGAQVPATILIMEHLLQSQEHPFKTVKIAVLRRGQGIGLPTRLASTEHLHESTALDMDLFVHA